MSPYIVCCILGYCITLLCLCLYNIGFLYYTNIQYTRLLYWAILRVHICYPVSFILGYSNNPVLSDLTSFYWFALIDQDFIISTLFSMALSFFWFSLVDQCFVIYYYKLGSLYKTSIIYLYQLYIGSLY